MKEVCDHDEEDRLILHNTTGAARKVHPGCPSLLQPVTKLRDQGLQMTNQMVSSEAARIVPAFHNKTTTAKVQIERRFTKHLGLTQRVATHTAQKHFKETEAESKDFVAMIKARLQE